MKRAITTTTRRAEDVEVGDVVMLSDQWLTGQWHEISSITTGDHRTTLFCRTAGPWYVPPLDLLTVQVPEEVITVTNDPEAWVRADVPPSGEAAARSCARCTPTHSQQRA